MAPHEQKLVLRCVGVLALAVCICPMSPAFEIGVEPDDFAEGTDLRMISRYITMSVATSTSTTPFAVTANEDMDGLQSTGSKVFGHVDIPFWSYERRLVLDFASPVGRVSIDANGNFDLDPEVGTLELYDLNGALLDSIFTPPLSGTPVTMSIARSEFDIARAVAYAANGPFLRLDNLLVEFAVDCDFDGDNACGIADINALLSVGPVAPGVPATGNEPFDLTADGVIDNQDVDAWLDTAAAFNGLAGPYKRGDADLDGTVDGIDFIAWNNRKFTATLLWNHGDFNGDGLADGLDFIQWNDNKFTSSNGAFAVPEPATALCALVAVLVMAAGAPNPRALDVTETGSLESKSRSWQRSGRRAR